MGKRMINVYVSSNNILTLATNELKEYYDKESGEIKTKSKPTKLVGYMEMALVEELPTKDLTNKNGDES